MYDEDDLLALSGIQHIAFCERQWALIHIEKQWAENVRTVEGKQLHKKVDNPYIFESRVDVVTARAVPIVSYKLGLYGVADIVEFRSAESPGNAVALPGK
ncbi:MAG: CRISPR-associated protein Cas4, partial [Caulobacteraceae bacterium]